MTSTAAASLVRFRASGRRVLATYLLIVCAGCVPDDTLSDEGRMRPPGAPGSSMATAGRGGGSGASGSRAASGGAAGAPGAEPAVVTDDGHPARLGPFALTLAVDCARVAASATRPVTAHVVVDVGGTTQDFALGAGATLFDAAFRVVGPAGAAASARLIARPATGIDLQSDPIAFTLPAPGGALVITEVLANPAGPETRQEYVELANLGAAPASTAGLRIEDAAGADSLPEALIEPGARALVVGATFDEQSPGDVPPRAGTALLRVMGRIGRDGLGQAGEVVRLVGPDGLVRSMYGGWVDTRRPAWAGHSVHRQPDETACDHPSAWTAAPLPETPGW